MGHLKTERLVLDGAEKNEVDIKYDVYVNKEGYFTTTLPEPWGQQLYKEEVYMNWNRQGKAGFFEASTLDNLNGKVKTAIQALVSKELIEEKIIIRYNIETVASYCIDKDGDIVPNGSHEFGFKGHEAKWHNGTLDNPPHSPKPYGIQMWVNPCIKRVYQYKNGKTKDVYDRLDINWHKDKSKPNLHWLNSLTGMSVVHQSHIKEIDYDETIAGFFVNLIKGMCSLNEKIRDFINPEDIKELASRGMKILNPKTIR